LEEKDAVPWTALFMARLIRTYPMAQQILSENYTPQALWASGVQLVSLNFQTVGASMMLHHGWFSQNGRCGYVLKPCFLRGQALVWQTKDDTHIFEGIPYELLSSLSWLSSPQYAALRPRPPSIVITLNLRMILNLRWPTGALNEYANHTGYHHIEEELKDSGRASLDRGRVALVTGDVVSDMVIARVEVYGVDADRCRRNSRPIYVIQGQGHYERDFSFPLLSRRTAECAQLYIEIRHRTYGRIAARAFPLARLREGSGVLHLHHPEASLSPIGACALLCDLRMREEVLTMEQFVRLQATGDDIDPMQVW